MQYANSERAKAIQEYQQSLEIDVCEARLQGFWDGALFKELKEKALFRDYRDLSFVFSMDGVQLCKIHKFDIWPLLLINLNLPPNERVKK